MPKGNKKGYRKNNDVATDVKLSDFADCSARKGRLRKSDGNSLSKEVEDLRNEDETLWFERELEEFELNITTDNPKKQVKESKEERPESHISQPGTHYPIDVWYLIGGFVKPEDVRLFASICKESYHVSRSYSFWIKMYKRYYHPNNCLPPRLQPDCIEQPFCLKICVIRTLYHLYPHFTTADQATNHRDVYRLSNLSCTAMWRVQQNGQWLFHFKLQQQSGADSCGDVLPLTYSVAIKDLWTGLSGVAKNQEAYVNLNPDEGCKILRFACSHYVSVPMVMGSRLADVRISLASDMRRHRVQLTFSKAPYSSARGGICDVLSFDSVENVGVLDWWHPNYPFDTIV